MKNLVKWFGIVALVAIVGFAMVSCGDDGGGGGNEQTSTVYESTDGENDYKLEIKKDGGKAAYTPQPGDSYILTITNITYKTTQTSEGKVTGISGGFTLKPANSETTFAIKIEGDLMNGITGTITLTNGETKEPPENFNPIKTYDAFYLKAHKWDGGGGGEAWDGEINLSEFTNRIPKEGDVFKFSIRGTTDRPIKWLNTELSCWNSNDWNDYYWLGGSESVERSGTIDEVYEIEIGNAPKSGNYIYAVSVRNVLWWTADGTLYDHGEKLPEGTQNGTIMATISNFRIALLPE